MAATGTGQRTRRAAAPTCVECGKRHNPCKFCGVRTVVWDKLYHAQEQKWRLIDHLTGEVHDCRGEHTETTETTATETKGTEVVEFDINRAVDAVMDRVRPEMASLMSDIEVEYELSDEIKSFISDLAEESGARAALEALPMTIEVRQPDKTTINVGHQHAKFEVLVKLMAARQNVMLVGGAGSGKTMGVEKAAEALGLEFYPKSMGPATTEYSLVGYEDATGRYVPGLLFKPFTEGGVVLLDEIDAANPAALTTMNTALANDYCSFPHGVFKKHTDFVLVASGNTFGRGADRMYVGRSQLDAATLNRFNILNWDYDEEFETALAQAVANGTTDKTAKQSVKLWASYVQLVRRAVGEQRVRMVIGTRDIVTGAQLIVAGFPFEDVAEMRIWSAASTDDAEKVKAAMKAIQTRSGIRA